MSLLICADARAVPLSDESVQCVVTSPPYWGLRKYAGEQELIWGGRKDCEHDWDNEIPGDPRGGSGPNAKEAYTDGGTSSSYARQVARGNLCFQCDAWRGAFGLEPKIEMYVAHTVEILREIRRVLRKDGVCFWNIGDSYQAGNRGASVESDARRGDQGGSFQPGNRGAKYIRSSPNRPTQNGLKPKDLCLIPQRVALAAQADGWWVRSDIIWSKPNPMPESVRDRPTDAYEHILMLTKSAKYYWDAEAVREPRQDKAGHDRYMKSGKSGIAADNYEPRGDGELGVKPGGIFSRHRDYNPGGRNLRNVWTFATQPYKGAHFATFPEELARRCIKAATRPESVVLDPFAGSGTVGKVAFELGRQFVMVDLSYQEHQRKRIPGAAFEQER